MVVKLYCSLSYWRMGDMLLIEGMMNYIMQGNVNNFLMFVIKHKDYTNIYLYLLTKFVDCGIIILLI